jgi:hypothetical protein
MRVFSMGDCKCLLSLLAITEFVISYYIRARTVFPPHIIALPMRFPIAALALFLVTMLHVVYFRFGMT